MPSLGLTLFYLLLAAGIYGYAKLLRSDIPNQLNSFGRCFVIGLGIGLFIGVLVVMDLPEYLLVWAGVFGVIVSQVVLWPWIDRRQGVVQAATPSETAEPPQSPEPRPRALPPPLPADFGIQASLPPVRVQPKSYERWDDE